MEQRVLIVDDEPDILEFMKYNLQKDGYTIFVAENGVDGIEIAKREKPHLILLDVMMPKMDGVEMCRLLRSDEELNDSMIIFLSALGSEESQLAGFEAGGDDYIQKPIKMSILRSRVRAIFNRIDQLPDSLELTIDPNRYSVTKGNEEVILPRKEFALLQLLMSQPEKLFTREEIYEIVWGEGVVVGDRTIDVHIRHLRKKIGERHIVTVKGVGYRFEK